MISCPGDIVREISSRRSRTREASMGTARLFFASAAAIGMLASAAFAEDNITGVITKIDRLNGTIAIQLTQSGTVGTGGGGAAREFKTKDAGMLESVHAGDRVSFSTAENNTITKLEKAK
jgi:Cu/Ag efflux protein CusF